MKKKLFDCSVKLERILEQNYFAKGNDFREKLNNINSSLSLTEHKYLSYVLSLKEKILNENYEPQNKEFENVVKILKYFSSKSFQSTSTVLGSHQLDFEKKLNEFNKKIQDEFGIVDPTNLSFIKYFFTQEDKQKKGEAKEIFTSIIVSKEHDLEEAKIKFHELSEENLKTQVFIKAPTYNKKAILAYFYFYLISKIKEFKSQKKEVEQLSLKQVCSGFFNENFIIVNDNKNYNLYLENDMDFYVLNFPILLRDFDLNNFFDEILSFLESNFISYTFTKEEKQNEVEKAGFNFFNKEALAIFLQKWELPLLTLLLLAVVFISLPNFMPFFRYVKGIFYTYLILVSLAFTYVLWDEYYDEDEEDELSFKIIRKKFIASKKGRLLTTLFFAMLAFWGIGMMAKAYMLSFLVSLAVCIGIYVYNSFIKELTFLEALEEMEGLTKIFFLLYIFSGLFIILTLLLHPVLFFFIH